MTNHATAEQVRTYAFAIDDAGRIVAGMDEHGRPRRHQRGSDRPRTVEDAGREIDALAKERAAERGIPYARALAQVIADPDHAELAAVYTGTAPQHLDRAAAVPLGDVHGRQQPPQPAARPSRSERARAFCAVAQEVDQAVRRVQERHPDLDYSAAMRRALDADPALAERYGRGR